MFLVDPKVFRFVVKGVKAIFLRVKRGWGLLMKFCPVVPEICRGQVHGARKERRITRTRIIIIIIIIIIRNGAKTISLQMLFGRLNNHT
jgi:hypothetical protein